MQLIYPIDTFEDNYNIVRDRFETDSVNVMKNRPLVAKKQRKSQYIPSKHINVDIWLKMKVEPTYIYRRCFNVGKTTLKQH